MEPLQFWTKVVIQKQTSGAWLVEIGGVVMFVCLLLTRVGRDAEFFLVGLVVGLLLVLMGLIATKKRRMTGDRIMDTDIVISSEVIRIGETTFPLEEVEYLDFLVNSYDGMPGPRMRFRRMVLFGTDNRLYFTWNGKKYKYGFYVEDEAAMRRLRWLFHELYKKGVRFRERNRGGRTFLFERVMDRKEFEERRKREGY
jgi:hypothetical protein